MRLSNDVREKLKQMRHTTTCRFDKQRKCFVDENGKRIPGITHILKSVMPVSGDRIEDSSRKKFKKSRVKIGDKDPVVKPCEERFAGKTMKRCGTCDDALAHVILTDRGLPELKERLAMENGLENKHGILVEAQLEIYVREGRDGLFKLCICVDPCVGTLLEQLDKLGLVIIATQIPTRSLEMRAATAADFLCVDRNTGSEWTLIELKATRNGENDENYEIPRGRNKSTTLRGVLQSYLFRHMFQVLCTKYMLETQFTMQFARSCVMRVAPGVVRTYDLHEYFVQKLPKLIIAIGAQTGGDAERKRAINRHRVQKVSKPLRAITKQRKPKLTPAARRNKIKK